MTTLDRHQNRSKRLLRRRPLLDTLLLVDQHLRQVDENYIGSDVQSKLQALIDRAERRIKDPFSRERFKPLAGQRTLFPMED